MTDLKELERDLKELERLENIIMVLETMTIGKGFSRTELESLYSAIYFLKAFKDFCIKNKRVYYND